jgi:hypothetical protein
MSDKKHICFYSNKCQWSKAFIQELAGTQYKNDFRFVCVDPSPNRPKLPDWLKKVPTLVINGENEPRTDSEVFNWIAHQRISTRQGQGQESMMYEPEGFIANEMNVLGGSDPYSFLDMDTSAQGDGGNRIAHSYEYINGQVNGPSIPEPKMTGISNEKKTKKEEMFDKQMEQYMKQRENGIPMPIARS